ncbi:MAG TPA: hypothetical protein VGX23_05720 [Actinocrinis sp.]|nr:hypothetical protein [Actinocrinis sp.]
MTAQMAGWFAATRICLALARRMRWRAMAFMEDAHRRGVLRQAGATYQFRHARLREQLVAEAARKAESS